MQILASLSDDFSVHLVQGGSQCSQAAMARLWLGADRQQGITWTIVDQGLCRHMESLDVYSIKETLQREHTMKLMWWVCYKGPLFHNDYIRDDVAIPMTLPWFISHVRSGGAIWRGSRVMSLCTRYGATGAEHNTPHSCDRPPFIFHWAQTVPNWTNTMHHR